MPAHSTPTRRDFLRGLGVTSGGLFVAGTFGAWGGHPRLAASAALRSADDTWSGQAAISHLNAIVGPAPIHIALANGYFADAGLDLEPVSFPGGSDTIRGMTSGMPLGLPATVSAITAYSKGMNDLRLVGGCFNGNQVLFIAPADSPVNSVDDLAGRKIGVSSPTSITTYFAELVVRELGLEPGADVEIIDIGGAPDAWTGATQGVVDVAWSSPPLSSQLIAAGDAKLIFHTKDYVTDWTDQMLVATQPFIDDRADIVQGFVTAVGQACELIRSNTDEAAEVYATAMDIDPEVAKAALEDPGLDSWDIEFDDAGIAANAEAALAMGQVEGEIDVEAMIIRDFVG